MTTTIGITHTAEAALHFFAPADLARLQAAARVVFLGTVQEEDPPAALAACDILTGSWGMPRLGAGFLAAAPRLRAVAYAAGSVRGFATPEAFARGITITTAMHANAIPVAETTVALITLASRHWFTCQDLLRREGLAGYHRLRRADGGSAQLPAAEPPVHGTFDLVVGLVGFGAIARLVQERLRLMDVQSLVYDPHTPAEVIRAAGAEPVDDLLALARRAEVISLHAPDLPATTGMCGAAFFQAMQDGAAFINTARGRLVDEAALIATLETGRITAYLDVTHPEPPVADSPLYRLPNCWLTPHRAGSNGRELQRLGRLATEECLRLIAGQPVLHPVLPSQLATMA